MLPLELKQKLVKLKSRIAEELSCNDCDGNIEEGEVCDHLYLGAEYMPEEGITALYNICHNLVLRRYDKEYNCDFEKEFKIFENSLKELYNKASKWELHYTDDGWYYSLSSLGLPNKLLEFCKELDNEFWSDEYEFGFYGENHCLDIRRMVHDSEVCVDCMIWERIYQIAFDSGVVDYNLDSYKQKSNIYNMFP